MNVLFLHYSFKKDGVTRCVLNNIKGLREISKDINFILAGEDFVPSIPSYVEKRYVNWKTPDVVGEIEKVSKDADIVIIENPVIGIFPEITLAFKKYSEKNSNKKIIYRIHDLIDDNPHLFEKFKNLFDNLNEIYPTTENVSFLCITSIDRNKLIQKGLTNVHILPNSVIISDLTNHSEKSPELKKLFEKEKILLPNEKILTYPVRVVRRKNIEEALLITKMLNESGENYRLIITIPFEKDYEKELKNLIKDYNISCSIGKASKYITFDKEQGFTIVDLYSISDFIISTSVREGFGFAFIEPWLASVPIIGRKLPVIKDFEERGIIFDYLYDNDIFPSSNNPKERMEKIREILSNPEEFKKKAQKLDIKSRIKRANEVIEYNKETIKTNYNHIAIARKFLEYISSVYQPQLIF